MGQYQTDIYCLNNGFLVVMFCCPQIMFNIPLDLSHLVNPAEPLGNVQLEFPLKLVKEILI